MQETQKTTIYTDGSCQPNPGPGGWGAVILSADGSVKAISGSAQHTTNNRMELQAAIEALKAVNNGEDILLFSDSKYLQQGISQWLPSWQNRGWLTSFNSEVKNRDLWQTLAKQINKHDIDWQWIKGHAGNDWNEKADQLARSAVIHPQLPLLEKKAIHIFTAISVKATKRGSWSAILRYQDHIKPLYGSVPETTGNRMHIHSAIAGLAAVKRPLPIHIYTFSGYLRDGASQWTRQWSRNNWLTKDGQPVSHKDLWLLLSDFCKRYDISWHLADKESPPCEMQEAKHLAQETIQELA